MIVIRQVQPPAVDTYELLLVSFFNDTELINYCINIKLSIDIQSATCWSQETQTSEQNENNDEQHLSCHNKQLLLAEG